MTDQNTSRLSVDPAFERKIRRSTWALVFEQVWPRLWLVLAIAATFVLVSLAGLWPLLPELAHKGLLALFAAALLAAIVYAGRVRIPSRDEAIRRIERVSGVKHRPASSFEDQLTGAEPDSTTAALWQAHRARLAALLSRLRVGPPHPRTDRYDPLALRALLLIGVLTLGALVGDGASDRLRAAFRFAPGETAAEARLDAWVAPPPYTGRAPILLADGARSEPEPEAATGKALDIPDRSTLIVRASGAAAGLDLELVPDGDAAPDTHSAPAPKTAADVAELRLEVRKSGRVHVRSGGRELAQWTFAVTPDAAPRIALTKDPTRTARGSMKLAYRAEDDYGVASATAKFRKVKETAADPARAWARGETLKGPRLPLERPPVMALRLPRANAKEAEGQTYLELGQHPWAGMKVEMVLEAKDVAGQTGESEPLQMVLPERRFEKPLARAVIEQRRKLVADSRTRGQVVKALEALTLEPEGFIDDNTVYLGLRSVVHRLQRPVRRATLKSAVDQLWHIALRIEDGDLSDAERALRDAQDKLSKALEDGASEEEIKQLMQELRQALNNYMEQLQKQAGDMPDMPEGFDPNSQMLSQQDLDRMMRNIEEMAKNGARDQAQQMLSELRDVLERLQTGRMSEQQSRQSQQMMKMMDELGNLVGEQQKLMDETFGELRRQDQQGEQGRQGRQQGQRSERPGRQPGQRGQQGQKGQQQGQRGEGQQPGQGQQGAPGQLGQRQGHLRDRLGRLQRDLGELGLGGEGEQFDEASEAMQNAERALQDRQFGEAAEEQGRALEELRQGAQQMAQEMMKNMPQRYGQSGDTPRDPLGRPQRSQGPDLGTSVKVPDEIDIQRAREILEELRRRIGEPTRPPVELDYLERLLRRF
jgi:uncharacterized protein (TIGR02302 family)